MMSKMPDWGPSHQTGRRIPAEPVWKWILRVLIALAVYGLLRGASHGESTGAIAGGAVWLAIFTVLALPSAVQRRLLAPLRGHRNAKPVGDPLQAARGAVQYGARVYLGLTSKGMPRYARAERAVLVLGPPRSGKTSGVIIPTLISHTGPAVSTSTKPDVWQATAGARGQAWVFDPTGSAARDCA